MRTAWHLLALQARARQGIHNVSGQQRHGLHQGPRLLLPQPLSRPASLLCHAWAHTSRRLGLGLRAALICPPPGELARAAKAIVCCARWRGVRAACCACQLLACLLLRG